jgi:phosphate:Na+ symporter
MTSYTAISAGAMFLAGLAFFFHGLEGVRESLQSLSGRSIRKRVAQFTSSGALAALWGFLLGAFAQSSTAASFIVSGFVSSRLLTLRRGLTMIAWANLGTVVLPFIASFDVRTAITLVLGTGGLLATFRAGREFLPAWRGAFMLGLLMLGLEFLKEATAPIPHQPWFRDVALQIGDSLTFGFLLGMLARLIIQSTSAIVVIAVSLSASGMLDERQAAMIVHGAGVGVGLTVLLLGSRSRGMPRQLAYFQAIINSFAGAVLAIEVAVTKGFGLPSLMDLAHATLNPEPSRMLAVVFLEQQLICVGLSYAAGNRWERWLAKLSPATSAQNLATPQHIDQGVGVDPASFLALAAQEQLRIIVTLPDLLDSVRADGARDRADCAKLAESCHALGAEIREALHELSQSRLTREDAEELLALDIRQRSIDQLVDELMRFAAAIEAERARQRADEFDPGSALLMGMTEGLHMVLTQLVQCIRDGSPDDIITLGMIAGDRGGMLEQMRADIAASAPTSGGTGLQFAMALFERSMWIVGKLAPPAPEGASDGSGLPEPGAEVRVLETANAGDAG